MTAAGFAPRACGFALLLLVGASVQAESTSTIRPTESHVESHVVAAASALAAGQLDRARPAIERAVATVGRRDAFAGIAQAMIDRGALDAARGLVIGITQPWLRQGDASDAATVLAVVASPAPANARVDALWGEALVKSEQHASALKPLLRAQKAGSSTPELRLYLATAYWETGALDDAESVLRAGLRQSAGGALWYHQLGRLLLWQGRGAEAADTLRQAADRLPTAPDLWLDLARAHGVAGDGVAAEAAFQQALVLAPDFAQAYYGLAQLQRQRGQTDQATQNLATFRRLYQAERERTRREGVATARLDQGWNLLRQGRASDAAAHFAQLDESVASLRGQAAALGAAGRSAEALAALERAVILAPDDAELRQLLARERLAASRGPSSP